MRDDKGQSPLDIALEDLHDEGCMDVALYLMSRGCACGDEDKAKLLCGVCWSGRLDMVKELVEHHKVDPKSECDDLHDCCVLEYFAGEKPANELLSSKKYFLRSNYYILECM